MSAPREVGSGVTSGVAGGRPRFSAGKPVAAGRPGLGGGLKRVSHGAHLGRLACLVVGPRLGVMWLWPLLAVENHA